MRENDMTRVETSNHIDLTTWEAFSLKPKLGKRITELMQNEFSRAPPRLSLPIQWAWGDEESQDGFGGPAPSDPAMLYVTLPLGPDEEGVNYACSLEVAVDDLIDLHEDRETEKIMDADGCGIAGKVAARLRELADKLDAACAPDTTGSAMATAR
jgi:hypothetical protein